MSEKAKSVRAAAKARGTAKAGARKSGSKAAAKAASSRARTTRAKSVANSAARLSTKSAAAGAARKADDGKKDLLALSAVHLLHRAGQCAGDVFTEEMTTQSLTPRQYAVLLTVAENEGLSQTGLVERTGIDRSTLADIIRRMLKKGLVNRKRTKEDARAYAVRLTAKGQKALSQAAPAAQDADRRILNALPKTKRDEFLNSLQIIVEKINSIEGTKKKE